MTFLKNISKDFLIPHKHLLNPTYYTPVIILYVVIVCIQVVYLYKAVYEKKTVTNLDRLVKYNQDNYTDIVSFLKQQLIERVELLSSGKMTYPEWLNYMSENHGVTFSEGHTYHFFVCERGQVKTPGDGDQFKIAANQTSKYINGGWKDIYNDAADKFVFIKQALDPNTLLRFFEMGKPGAINKITYYWVDYIEGKFTPILEDSYFMVIPGTKDNNEAIISVSLDMDNLKANNTFYYVKYTRKTYIVMLSIMTLIIAIMLYASSTEESRYNSFIFLILTNYYLTEFLDNSEYHGTTETELKKIQQVNSGVLSVSFLIGVNTFIITYLTKNDHKDLFVQSALIFAVSVIILLIAAFKTTDTITVNQLLTDRLSNQLLFNFCLLMNIFVVFSYILSVLKKHK